MKKAILMLAFFAVSPSNAEGGFDDLQIDAKACNLVHSGSGNKDIVYSGEIKFSMCHIVVPIEKFNEQYSFCALSGVLAREGEVACEFGHHDKQKKSVFFVSGTKQLCEFVCVKQ